MENLMQPKIVEMDGMDIHWVDAENAISASSNPYSAMSKANDRVRPAVWPHLVPEFPVNPGAKIFTIGSCFARNVEDNLNALGYNLPTLDFSVPQTELAGRPANLLNKYTPASIYQEVAFAYKIYKRDGVVTEEDIDWLLYEEKPGLFIDLGLASLKPVTKERFLERRQDVYNVFKNVFEADLVTLTLGLIEAWYDTETQAFVQFAPTRSMRKQKGRYQFCQMPYPVCLEYIRKTIDLIREVNECKFLITTSPVSLARTFTKSDVIISNTESKSVLRAVCGQINRDYDYVGYFPSFESAILTKDPDVFLKDNIHVAPEFVGELVGSLVSTYFSDAPMVSIDVQKARTEHLKNNSAGVIELLAGYAGSPEFTLDGVTLLLQALVRTKQLDQAVEVGMTHEAMGLQNIEPSLRSRFYSVLRSAFLSSGNTDEAMRCAKIAISCEPHLPVWSFEYANTLYRSERFTEAEEIFRMNLEWVDTPIRKFQFAQVLMKVGKSEEARSWLYPLDNLDMPANMYFEICRLLKSMKFDQDASHVLEQGLVVYPQDSKLIGLKK